MYVAVVLPSSGSTTFLIWTVFHCMCKGDASRWIECGLGLEVCVRSKIDVKKMSQTAWLRTRKSYKNKGRSSVFPKVPSLLAFQSCISMDVLCVTVRSRLNFQPLHCRFEIYSTLITPLPLCCFRIKMALTIFGRSKESQSISEMNMPMRFWRLLASFSYHCLTTSRWSVG